MKIIKNDVYITPEEMCFVQYMPIKFSYSSDVCIPENLHWVEPVVYPLLGYALFSDYVYLTVKHLYTERGSLGNRPGWHIDGYMSDDLNFIWCDKNPTEYVPSLDSYRFSENHVEALREMEIADTMAVYEIPINSIVNIERTVHRTKENISPGLRTFIKVSISKHKYNLQGNAKNPIMNYNWKMYPRTCERNHPYVLEE